MIERKPEWKQDCPRDQLVVTLSAIEGHRLNAKDKIITAEQFLEKTERLFADVGLLTKMIGSGSWNLEE